jgi:phenylalanyl-tRNA synthetase beta chain
VPPDHDERLNWPLGAEAGVLAEGAPAWEAIRLVNPLSSQHSVLRRDLVASLLDVLSTNVRQGREDVAIFEIGKGYGLLDGAPHEWWRLAIVATGAAEPRAWNRPLRPYDLDDLKGIVELVARELGFGRPSYEASREGYPLHPGRAARVVVPLGHGTSRAGSSPIGSPPAAAYRMAGIVGELHPDVLERWEIRADRVVAAELAICGLGGGQLPSVKAAPVPRFPAVERDVAVVVPEGRPSVELEHAIREAAGDLLRDLRLFDVYPMPNAERSLAFRLQFQASDRTLTESEIEDAIGRVMRTLERSGGRLRT